MSPARAIGSLKRWLRARRRYECPRCRFSIPNTIAKCPRCGWIDVSTTANLEAHGGLLANQGGPGPTNIPGPV
jgi:predicted RNA-binding Zn-ribbon protein involved in translation (DUF1610 family)